MKSYGQYAYGCRTRRRKQNSPCSRDPFWKYVVFGGCGLLLTAGATHADPLSSPSFAGPLAPNPNPLSVDAGPLGKVYVSGQLTGLGMVQNHTTSAPGTGNANSLLDLSNGQIEIQTTSGPLQFYVQAGTYSLPSLGTSYLRSDKALDELYGPVPVAYAKAVFTPDWNVMAGALPTLIGAESTFTFQNINIERGLLWNQEPAISKGVQLNYSHGPLTAAISLNDGYYSGKYSWLSGTLSYAINGTNTISIVGGGNLSRTGKSSFATPIAQDNSSIFNLIYTYTRGPLTVNPYLQYSHVDRSDSLGIDRSADTYGAALLVKYAVTGEFSLGARAEYLKSSGGSCGGDASCSPTNLLYGANSDAWSLTFTPTFQRGVFFARTDLSYTRIGGLQPGLGFGSNFNNGDQVRGILETGILF
jgi:hypothetical protein